MVDGCKPIKNDWKEQIALKLDILISRIKRWKETKEKCQKFQPAKVLSIYLIWISKHIAQVPVIAKYLCKSGIVYKVVC